MDALRASLESDKSSSKKPKAKPTRFGGSVFMYVSRRKRLVHDRDLTNLALEPN
jgi:hypothetical protein